MISINRIYFLHYFPLIKLLLSQVVTFSFFSAFFIRIARNPNSHVRDQLRTRDNPHR